MLNLMVIGGYVQMLRKILEKNWKSPRPSQGLFTDSKEGLEKIEKRSQNRSKLGQKPSFFRGGQLNFQKILGGSRICVWFLTEV